MIGWIKIVTLTYIHYQCVKWITSGKLLYNTGSGWRRLGLIHLVVWQNPTQHRKAITRHLKKIKITS